MLSYTHVVVFMFFMEPPVLPDFDGSSRMHQEECEEDQDQDHYYTNTNTPQLVHRAAWYVPVDGSGPDDGSSNESSQVSRSPLEEWQYTSHAGYTSTGDQPQYAWNIGEQPRNQSYGIEGIGALGLDPQHANIMEPTVKRTGRFLFFFFFFVFPNNRARSLYLCPSAAGGFIAPHPPPLLFFWCSGRQFGSKDKGKRKHGSGRRLGSKDKVAREYPAHRKHKSTPVTHAQAAESAGRGRRGRRGRARGPSGPRTDRLRPTPTCDAQPTRGTLHPVLMHAESTDQHRLRPSSPSAGHQQNWTGWPLHY